MGGPVPMNELWRTPKSTSGLYEVSNLGRVRRLRRLDSLGRVVAEKVLSPAINKILGYVTLTSSQCGKNKVFYVHRLVAECFCDKPDDCDRVNHIDGNRANNCAENLEWVTHSENLLHAYRTGLAVHRTRLGSDSPAAKLVEADVVSIRSMLTTGVSVRSIARMFGVVPGTILHIKSGATWSHVA